MNRRKAIFLKVTRTYTPRSDLDQRPTLVIGQVFRNLGYFYLGEGFGFHHMIPVRDGRVFAFPADHFSVVPSRRVPL